MLAAIILTAISTVVSLAFSISVLRQFMCRRKIHQLVWSAGLFLFAASTMLEFLSEIYGWSIAMYKLYYLLIALLVAVLGLGTAYLLGNRIAGHAFALYIFAIALFMAYSIAYAHVDAEKLTAGQTVAGSAMQGSVRLLSPLLTVPGAVSLIGGALYSWYRTKTTYNIFIGAGALMVAGAGALARFGIEEMLYVAELAGIAVMYIGFIKSKELIKQTQ